ncbi:MAG TPA: hypothetical protein VNE39_22725 [Planctomycetota bacterium]|nr:hypothetical protein [Planctomycetota bacterium]
MQLRATGRRVLLVGVLGAALLAGAVGPARGGEAVVLGCASAADLKGLFGKLGKLAEKFVPGTGPQALGLGAMLTQAPEWAGVDWSKPATIVLFGGKAFGKAEPVPVVVVTLADAALFRQAHPEGAPVAFEVRGDLAVVSPERAALAAMTPQRLEIYGTLPKIAGTADVYATVYAAQAVAEYQGEIDAALKEIEQQAGQMMMPGPMANIGKIFKCLGPLVNLAGKQVRRASLTVELKDDSVELWGRLYAGDDTELGTFFSGQPGELTDLVKYLPAEAAMAMAAKLDLAKGKPLFEAILKAIATPLDLTTEDQVTLRELVFGSTQTGEFAVALAGGAAHPGIQSAQVVRIADAEKFRTASKNGTEWFTRSGLGALMEAAGVKMSIEYKPGVREYKGAPVDRITVTMAQAPDAPPNPMMGQQQPQVTEFAAIGTLGAAVGGNPGGELLNGILDRIKGEGAPGLDTAAAWKAAVAAAPNGSSVVVSFSFNNLLAKAIEEAAKQQPAIALMAGAIIKADPTEEPITTYAGFGANMVEFRTRVPHQPILSLVTRVRMLIEQQPGRKPGPKPKEEDDF